jgi:hypothetical protein
MENDIVNRFVRPATSLVLLLATVLPARSVAAQGFGLTAEAFAEGSARFLTERADADVNMIVLGR